ncbi:WD repeat-containing protein on Y chromosome [Diachasma alloeum]|uniref:WD repeat-containing protein on Y chromosome n=1 Tax=Diachasma alloeum TaxID=454923 RepID=UPI0010FB162C|nr:WD repeat-containing protein on Y chromosome [Diachasma alloeum]
MEEEVKSLLDGHEDSIHRKFTEFFGKKNVEEQCDEEKLSELHEAYKAAKYQEMDETQLHEAFEKFLKIRMSKEDFAHLFKQMDSMRDERITWDEFVSYLLLEFRLTGTAELKSQPMELPLKGPPELLPTRHRSAICRIIFSPYLISSENRSSSFQSGRYLTVSKDGVINYWSLDLVHQKSVKSINPDFKVQSTIITDIIAMPDVQVVCTSSVERDLRFYDTAAGKFDLRIRITSLRDAVICMAYYFSEDIRENSYIILGDTGGSVRVIAFSPFDRGPFKQNPRRETLEATYESLLKGHIDGLVVTEFNRVHSDWVSEVKYYGGLRGFLSCAKCSNCSLLLSDPSGTKMRYEFRVHMGISCFTVFEEKQLLMTGGPDCLIRAWNPFVPYRPNAILRGHRSPICFIAIQPPGTLAYSLSKDRCIKVWDISSQSCVQTYNSLPSELSERTPMSVIYNSVTQKLIIASMMIALVSCQRVIDEEISDGETHTKGITCLVYNPLFKMIVSTGTDSCIMYWDPWTGKRIHCITNAHSKKNLGSYEQIEITAATFDYSYQLLITGGRDGSLKIWSFNSGSCIKNMVVEDQCGITGIIWLKNRILCAGWNGCIVEFADTETGIYRKSWEKRHTEEILCAAVRFPQALVTASYNGELIMWRMETGQPYRRYQVENPTERYNIVYKTRRWEMSEDQEKSVNFDPKRNNESQEKSALAVIRTVSVRCVMFLCSRDMEPNVGSLLVALDSGFIQVWSHHVVGGFLKAFNVKHVPRDCCICMATDPENDYLITGHLFGYIKVWYIRNYGITNPPRVNMPSLRLEFPFLWKDRVPGRAKRAVKDQPLPILLTSFKGHTKSITAVQYLPEAKIIISGSRDHTVKLWSISGRYISTFGTLKPWRKLLPDVPVSEYLKDYSLPPDVKRIGSSTTIKVFEGGYVGAKIEDFEEMESMKEVPDHERHLLYGQRLEEPILGQSYSPGPRPKVDEKPKLDNTLAYIPVYSHLKTPDLLPLPKRLSLK